MRAREPIGRAVDVRAHGARPRSVIAYTSATRKDTDVDATTRPEAATGPHSDTGGPAPAAADTDAARADITVAMTRPATAALAPHALPAAGPARTRIPVLDVARGWAMIGVVLMNVSMIAVSAESLGKAASGPVSSAVNVAATFLFSGRSRELLMILLGIGAVLTWRSALRRGDGPVWLLVRRYAVLFAVFGLAHRYFFDGDILTHYAAVAPVLVVLLPLLLAGARWRPLALAGALIPLSAVLQAFATELPFDLQRGLSTLAAFAVGVWLARLPRFAGAAAAGDDESTTRRAVTALRLTAWSLALSVVSLLIGVGTSLAFPRRFDAEGIPLPRTPVESGVMAVGNDVLLVGGALLYFGLIWWLVDREGTGARVMGALLAPIGRMSLTVYLGSTALFLLTMGGRDGEFTVLTQLGIAAGYFAVMAVICPLWLRAFRYGPAEWLWRCLTYLRPLAIRRRSLA